MKINSIDWSCPSIEPVQDRSLPDREKLAAFKRPQDLAALMIGKARLYEGERYILPLWQNLEALVIGSRISGDGEPFLPDRYCLDNLRQMEGIDCTLRGDPMIEAVIEVIREYRDQPLVLEVESPFSILGALINPVDLYGAIMEERDLVMSLLDRIAEASAGYIRACINAGCRIISIADPLGSMDMVGEECYRSLCGPAQARHLKKIRPCLTRAIVHICRKMSLSMLASGFMESEKYRPKIPVKKYTDLLYAMADDPDVFYTGLTCMHVRNPDPGQSCILSLKSHS